MNDAERIKNEFDLSLLSKNEKDIKTLKKAVADLKDSWFSLVYPVGSIYMSVSSTSPSSLFGGSWVRIQDKFLLCAGSTYPAGSTGGAANHTHTTGDHALTTAEMPAHAHDLYFTGSSSSDGTEYYLYNSGLSKIYASSARNTIAVNTSGSGAAHNHGSTGSQSSLPPYISVYVWRRTA